MANVIGNSDIHYNEKLLDCITWGELLETVVSNLGSQASKEDIYLELHNLIGMKTKEAMTDFLGFHTEFLREVRKYE
jgi:hypothetical protein